MEARRWRDNETTCGPTGNSAHSRERRPLHRRAWLSDSGWGGGGTRRVRRSQAFGVRIGRSEGRGRRSGGIAARPDQGPEGHEPTPLDAQIGPLPGGRRRLRDVHQADALRLREDGGGLPASLPGQGIRRQAPRPPTDGDRLPGRAPVPEARREHAAGHDGLLQPAVQLAGALRLPQRAHESPCPGADQHGDADARGDASAHVQYGAARPPGRQPPEHRRGPGDVLRAPAALRPQRARPGQLAAARGAGAHPPPRAVGQRQGTPRRRPRVFPSRTATGSF